MNYEAQQTKSYLLIGGTGRTGVEILRKLMTSGGSSRPEVHVFCQHPTKVPDAYYPHCASIIKGDGTNQHEIESALSKTHADTVIIAIGDGDSSKKKSNVRTLNAQAVSNAMQKPGFQHVSVVLVSIAGAGGSKGGHLKSKKGFIGMKGRAFERHFKQLVEDHEGQEGIFRKSVPGRTWIVRPTILTSGESVGGVYYFQNEQNPPTKNTDRADLGNFLVDSLLRYQGKVFGSTVNITGKES